MLGKTLPTRRSVATAKHKKRVEKEKKYNAKLLAKVQRRGITLELGQAASDLVSAATVSQSTASDCTSDTAVSQSGKTSTGRKGKSSKDKKKKAVSKKKRPFFKYEAQLDQDGNVICRGHAEHRINVCQLAGWHFGVMVRHFKLLGLYIISSIAIVYYLRTTVIIHFRRLRNHAV